jgi:4-amino-4-deoxy-L-arabinose transferase-like glycosyltransferase
MCVAYALIYHRRAFLYLLVLTFPVAIAITSMWLLSAKFLTPFNSSPYSAWMLWNRQSFVFPSIDSLAFFIKYSAWFTWPAWPFAGWALYAWRKQIKALHIIVPLLFIIALVFLALCNDKGEQSSLIPLIPPLSILAAFGLPTMKRGAINAVDWFSVLAFSLAAAFIWAHWIAMQTGWPAQLHHNVYKVVPGFVAQFNPYTFGIALLVTGAWIKLVHWRISRHPGVLWRAVVLSSGGVILCWLLAMTLWMPWINYRISYAPLAYDIAAHLPPNYNCVDTNITPAQRASFAYFGKIRFANFDVKPCDYFLAQARGLGALTFSGDQAVWQGTRASDKTDGFFLFKMRERSLH